MENELRLKMYFHVFPIENGDIPASYVSLPEGFFLQQPELFRRIDD